MAYQIGQKLGNYQLEGFLGYGGFAEVYLAKHIYLKTSAAIKVLHKQISDDGLEKFLQEARIIAGLKHPHIVGVLEFGIEEQHPFLVMEYAPRGTLRKYYTRGKPLSPATILPHIMQIADALQYAHERKIIHRDVKPENMLLNKDNTVLLSDFGLALQERNTYNSVRSTDSAGTTLYMSPEQLRGKPCTASDQYALGVVMYEWLCGCLPFDGPDVSIIVQHLHEAPASLRDHVPTLSLEVEAVVLKALEKDPKQRFANIQELARAFEKACAKVPEGENSIAPGASPLAPEVMEPWQEYLFEVKPQENSYESELLAQNDSIHGVEWPSQHSSLHGPSLPAALSLKAAENSIVESTVPMHEQVTGVLVSTTSPQDKGRVSRRVLIGGIAGIAALAGGIGVWRFSPRQVELLVQTVQVAQKGVETTTTTSTSNPAGKNGSRGASGSGGNSASTPTGSNKGAGKGSTANSVTSHNNTTTSTGNPTPITSSNNNNGGDNNNSGNNNGNTGSSPVATSTPAITNNDPGTTPVPTSSPDAAPPLALTVQMSNIPTSIRNNTTAVIAVTTNIGNTPFQFQASYALLRQQPDVINGTTDANGNATVNWTPSLPFVLFITRANANLSLVATDQNGNQVSAQSFQVLVTRF